jgi:hypothetical protein
MDHEKSKEYTTRCAPQFLKHLHATGKLLELLRRKGLQVREARNHANGVLNGTQRQGIAAGEPKGGNQRSSSEGWLKQLQDTRTLKLECGFFLATEEIREGRDEQGEAELPESSNRSKRSPSAILRIDRK